MVYHYQFVYLDFSVFQLVSTICFSIFFVMIDTVIKKFWFKKKIKKKKKLFGKKKNLKHRKKFWLKKIFW
jgi:hypothetical protein